MKKHIIIAPDSFKGSLSSQNAAHAIASGILSVVPDADIIEIPVADGGDGTLERLVKPENIIETEATITDGQRDKVAYGFVGNTAVIEMARVAGLTLVDGDKLDPLKATTYGVGELIIDALNRGFREFIITVGGSGTNDGGIGMLAALGGVLYDINGKVLSGCGRSLVDINRIDITNIDNRLNYSRFVLACDVSNVLVGMNGATFVYGPQKGADLTALELLEAGMNNYAEIMSGTCGFNVSSIPGSGAGGGVGVPLLALFGAKIKPGINAVLDAVGYYGKLADCECVITGEGRVDGQTLSGKAVSGVATPAVKLGIPVYVFAGCRGNGAEQLSGYGIKSIYTLTDDGTSGEYAISHAADLLYKLGARFAEKHLINN